MDQSRSAFHRPDPRYGSFLIKRWVLRAAERIEVSHLQSGRVATLAGLDEVTRWIASQDSAGGRQQT
jgi:hypothetical protein